MEKVIKTKFDLNNSDIFQPSLTPESIIITSHHKRLKDRKTSRIIELSGQEMYELFDMINKFGEESDKRISISQSTASEIRKILNECNHPRKAFLSSMLT